MSKCREAFEKLYSSPLVRTSQGHYIDLEVADALLAASEKEQMK